MECGKRVFVRETILFIDIDIDIDIAEAR